MSRLTYLLLLPALAAALAAGCGGGGPSMAPTATPSHTPVPPSPTPPGEPRLEVVIGADFPVALAFTPDGRLFYNELRSGRIRIVEDGELRPEPFAELEVVRLSTYSEHGLLGLAIDPAFQENRYVYAFYSVPAPDGSPLKQRLVRFTEVDGRGTAMTVILDDLPIGPCCHNGGRIAFGPRGKLYLSLGDTQDPNSAQDEAALSGKILRLNPDGTIPEDNPVPGSPPFALGLRNPFGIAFRPGSGELFASENGPSGHDELNRVLAGANYGWPQVMGIAGEARFEDPIFETGGGTLAPTGLTFYSGDLLPFRGDLFFCSFASAALFQVKAADIDRVLASPERDAVEVLDTGQPCSLDVKTGPDGALYLSDIESIYRWGP